ncbi:MAG: glycerol-3-phosphate 1-O-acyltransferase PlsY [Erysipelotrichaceae bacterium]|nr:glycerol-3-phosphate 1-O-acyltransferase PlsY [Erysipelotrichaceae bacterium]
MEILILILAYLFGSIPWALVIGKVFYKTDIRNHGSGNLGGSNAGRVLGKKAGVAVIALDALKALLSVVLAKVMNMSDTICVLAGLMCCVGHCFPIFANFKGGKAVATTVGFVIGISVLITHEFMIMSLIPIVTFFVVLKLTKFVSLSSMIAIGMAAVCAFIAQDNLVISLSITVLWLFVCYRHKANIGRLLKGNETKITWM